MSDKTFTHMNITIDNNELYHLIYRYAKIGAFSELPLNGGALSDYYYESGRYVEYEACDYAYGRYELYEDQYNRDKVHNNYEEDELILKDVYKADDEDPCLRFGNSEFGNRYVVPECINDVIPCLLIYLAKEFHWDHELFLRFKAELLGQASELAKCFRKVEWEDDYSCFEAWIPNYSIHQSFIYNVDEHKNNYSVSITRWPYLEEENISRLIDYNWDELDHRGENPDKKRYSWNKGNRYSDREPYKDIVDKQSNIY